MSNPMMYVATMAVVTYLIRVLPLTLLNKPITNIYIQSFLYYVPYVTLAVMTFPAILSATASPISALSAFVVAILLAWFGASLFQVSVLACVMVFIIEILL